ASTDDRGSRAARGAERMDAACHQARLRADAEWRAGASRRGPAGRERVAAAPEAHRPRHAADPDGAGGPSRVGCVATGVVPMCSSSLAASPAATSRTPLMALLAANAVSLVGSFMTLVAV